MGTTNQTSLELNEAHRLYRTRLRADTPPHTFAGYHHGFDFASGISYWKAKVQYLCSAQLQRELPNRPAVDSLAGKLHPALRIYEPNVEELLGLHLPKRKRDHE